jgi:hypothetical protein
MLIDLSEDWPPIPNGQHHVCLSRYFNMMLDSHVLVITRGTARGNCVAFQALLTLLVWVTLSRRQPMIRQKVKYKLRSGSITSAYNTCYSAYQHILRDS